MPVIASLNASSTGGWVRYAHLLAEAGADALELNVYRVPTDPQLNAAQVEELDLALVANVCEAVSLPVAVKLSPYYSAMAHFAAKVVAAGADGLVLFNRFYQPDLDLETMDVVPRVELSRSLGAPPAPALDRHLATRSSGTGRPSPPPPGSTRATTS